MKYKKNIYNYIDREIISHATCQAGVHSFIYFQQKG